MRRRNLSTVRITVPTGTASGITVAQPTSFPPDHWQQGPTTRTLRTVILMDMQQRRFRENPPTTARVLQSLLWGSDLRPMSCKLQIMIVIRWVNENSALRRSLRVRDHLTNTQIAIAERSACRNCIRLRMECRKTHPRRKIISTHIHQT